MQDTDMDAVALQAMLNDPGHPDVVILRRDGFLARAFSKESLRILDALDGGPVEGMSALAERLGRDRTRVSKDVHFLEGLGLVAIERRGRTTTVRATGAMIVVR